VNRLWAGQQEFNFWQGQGIFFSSPLYPDKLLGPPSLLSNGYQGLFAWVKWLGCEADHSSSSSAEVKICGAIPSFPHTSPWHGA
jgi:hypothetical protein